MDEYYEIHRARYDRILSEIDIIRPGKKILDVGCYPWHLGAALEQKGYTVSGIASSHEPIHSKRVKICNIESDRFPFPADTFDLVLFTEVLEHLPQNPLHALREMHRITKKTGKLLITTPNIARSITRAKGVLGRSVTYPLSQVLENTNIYHRHNREYTMEELKLLVTHAGWTVEKAEYFVSYTPWRNRPGSLAVKLARWVNYALMQTIPPLRDTLLVIASA